MRPSINTQHIFTKELNSKFSKPQTPARPLARNPILLEPEPVKISPKPSPINIPKQKPRMLALTDFSQKAKGTFSLHYDTTEAPKYSKKFISKPIEDPIKPTEFIPPAKFKRPERNPILNGDLRKETEQRVNPHQVSNVFKTQTPGTPNFQERKKNMVYKNQSSVFQEVIPEARTDRIRKVTETEELLQYKYAPNYRDSGITIKPSTAKYDKGELRQYDDLKNFTSVMREKRNSSSIFN